MKTINFAIDLGTTNSLVAKYDNGKIKIFNNPLGLKQTLPSCIAFRGNRIVIGDKALDYLEKDAENVCMLFKRKMGTQDTYFVPSLDKEMQPIELSSLVLKELKNFLPDDEVVNSVVITIPAAFDTIQSNATKKAGYLAGFKEVVLLQEPIAACLAFANTSNTEVKEKEHWIVYDFGGGTFDVALVEVDERELKVVDHQGDNYLGGADFDNLIVKNLIVPFIEEKTGQSDLWKSLKSKSSTHKGLYFELLKKAEEAKKELSNFEETEIELDFSINDVDLYDHLIVKREVFENLILSNVENTVTIIKDIIKDNQLLNSDIKRVILIGGTTYIPLIKKSITNAIGVEVNSSIDPTSAVVEGAAYYAGSKPSELKEDEIVEEEETKEEAIIDSKFFYEQNTRDAEELITAKFSGVDIDNYRIIRKDGGYDSGVKGLKNNSFSEFVPLLEGRLNQFKVQLLNSALEVLKVIDPLSINHGSYSVNGQPLPNDICMEVDDLDASATRLERIFAKGSILPLKKKIYKTASKTILKKSKSNLAINVIEGRSNGLPSSGLSIGYIEIFGEDLEDDLIKGTDIEIELEISESRELKINVFLQSCDQEFENVFSESERSISVNKINTEINTVLSDVEAVIKTANANENFEYSNKLESIRVGLIEIQIEASMINDDDISDTKFQLDDRKRKLIQDFDDLTRNEIVAKEIEEYNDTKADLEYHLNQNENERYKTKYQRIIQNEKEVINSLDRYLIRSKIKELEDLFNAIIQSSDENFISYYLGLKLYDNFTNKRKAEKLFDQGDKALEQKDYKVIRHVVYGLSALVHENDRHQRKDFNDNSKTGLN
ncbi:Hsp70 family protein [Winogradskyella marincola]|uniref:Hsp70 family protein n=2 Tax=Flavobacteriaceae TaxID=49546 RepID=A0ABT6G490_9FLAO|nr:Hsp70 family protein [Winogradskyella sp. YYF002]MDG4716860.1 Hsp70 family protein [Winogradskyella sp. YYF002]